MKKYMAIKETIWKEYHDEWVGGDLRCGMKLFTAYEIEPYNGRKKLIVLKNKITQKGAYFEPDEIYEVTPKENPEYFL
jgi:hypothetical protein